MNADEINFEKRMKFGQYTVIIITVTGFLIYLTVALVTAHMYIFPFGPADSTSALISHYSVDAGFLILFLLMLALNINLFIQIRRKNKLLSE